MPNETLKVYDQGNAYASPWTVGERVRMVLWDYCWALFCSWTPKNLNFWRLIWLRLFGTTVYGTPFVHQRARIQKPWNLILHDRSTLGDRTNAYSLGTIEIRARATVAQETYLCTGTHDFGRIDIPLVTAPIVVEEDAFVGARAFIMPGVTIGAGAVIGAASVVTKSVPEWSICAGNPCRTIKPRPRFDGNP